jgi:hypothetical protein
MKRVEAEAGEESKVRTSISAECAGLNRSKCPGIFRQENELLSQLAASTLPMSGTLRINRPDWIRFS